MMNLTLLQSDHDSLFSSFHPFQDLFFQDEYWDDLFAPFLREYRQKNKRRRLQPQANKEKAVVQQEQEEVVEEEGPSSNTVATLPAAAFMSTDLIETDDAYLIHMDLPGIPPQDIDISLQAGEKASILTIQAERKALFDDKKDKAHSVERVIGKVQRRIRLPGNADCDQTQTSYKEGVLMIRLAGSGEAVLAVEAWKNSKAVAWAVAVTEAVLPRWLGMSAAVEKQWTAGVLFLSESGQAGKGEAGLTASLPHLSDKPPRPTPSGRKKTKSASHTSNESEEPSPSASSSTSPPLSSSSKPSPSSPQGQESKMMMTALSSLSSNEAMELLRLLGCSKDLQAHDSVNGVFLQQLQEVQQLRAIGENKYKDNRLKSVLKKIKPLQEEGISMEMIDVIRQRLVKKAEEDQLGATVLHISASRGHHDFVKLLLQHPDIQVNQTVSLKGMTPLIAACAVGRTEVVKVLLSSSDVDVNRKTKDGWIASANGPALDIASAIGSALDIASAIASDVMKDGFSALFVAIFLGSVDTVKVLLADNRVDVDKVGMNGIPVVHLTGSEEIKQLLKEKTVKMEKKGFWGGGLF
eukprot:gene7450-8238_t